MKIHFLGTAAAEGWPALYCKCDACTSALRLGGKNIRTRTGAIIDQTIKIDFGPDTYMQALRDSVSLADIHSILFTHSHHDHFIPEEMELFQPPYAWNDREISVYGNDAIVHRIGAVLEGQQQEKYHLHEVRPFEPIETTEMRITPLLADHNPSETCMVYLIERDGKSLLWGHDSGYLPDASWAYLTQHCTQRGPLSAAVLDCTNGPLDGIRGHMGVDGVLMTKEDLLKGNIANAQTVFVATHFSHNGKLLHDELETVFKPHDVLVAYDGLRLTI